jgi:hypothetical protein
MKDQPKQQQRLHCANRIRIRIEIVMMIRVRMSMPKIVRENKREQVRLFVCLSVSISAPPLVQPQIVFRIIK